MAPPKDVISSDEADLTFILNIIATSEEFKVNAHAAAEALGMKHTNNLYPKLHRILSKHGFKYENKKIFRNSISQAGGGAGLLDLVEKSEERTKPVEDLESDVELAADTLSKISATESAAQKKPKGKKRKINHH